MEKLTFIIACHNELSHTKKGVKSILDNSSNINFVFIDNGSTDGTYDFLQSVPNSYVIRNKENIYVNPAWNQGFKYVLENDLGDYVCLCNNDIQAGRNWTSPIFDLFCERIDEFYLPMSNTQDNPPFHSEEEFHRYTNEAWVKPLELVEVRSCFVGFCFFMLKKHIKHFYPVPEQMKVLRGDDWITDCLVFNNILPKRVSRCTAHHFNGATQRGMPIHGLRDNDVREFDKLYQTVYKAKGMGRIYENKIRVPLL